MPTPEEIEAAFDKRVNDAFAAIDARAKAAEASMDARVANAAGNTAQPTAPAPNATPTQAPKTSGDTVPPTPKPKPVATNSEVFGDKTVTLTDKSITSVDKDGNGFSATVKDNGMLEYFEIKQGEQKPLTRHNRDIHAPDPIDALEDLHAIAIVRNPKSPIGKACATAKPYEMEQVMNRVRVIGIDYKPGEIESLPKKVERMKTGTKEDDGFPKLAHKSSLNLDF